MKVLRPQSLGLHWPKAEVWGLGVAPGPKGGGLARGLPRGLAEASSSRVPGCRASAGDLAQPRLWAPLAHFPESCERDPQWPRICMTAHPSPGHPCSPGGAARWGGRPGAPWLLTDELPGMVWSAQSHTHPCLALLGHLTHAPPWGQRPLGCAWEAGWGPDPPLHSQGAPPEICPSAPR